jgi:hypothetical protein
MVCTENVLVRLTCAAHSDYLRWTRQRSNQCGPWSMDHCGDCRRRLRRQQTGCTVSLPLIKRKTCSEERRLFLSAYEL